MVECWEAEDGGVRIATGKCIFVDLRLGAPPPLSSPACGGG